ncbi:hypothetical protein AB3X92_06705 [Paraburkholderia sp. BR14317]
MIKGFFWGVVILTCGSTFAKSTCADIHGQQSYPPLDIKAGTICFVQEPVLNPKTGTQIGADAISMYYISNGNAPVKAEGRGLLYDDTPGEIVDAFSLMVAHGHREEIFVIHSVDIRESLVEPNSSGKFYSVAVFAPFGNTLRRDERASEWFGADYSWVSDERKKIYEYPYKSKNDVQQAMNSPFATLMSTDGLISVRLKSKSYLFEDPNVKSKTRKYLIKGDRATVDKATAGWCQIAYSGGTKPLVMWLMCHALDANVQEKNRN